MNSFKRMPYTLVILILSILIILVKENMGYDYFKKVLCFLILPTLISVSFSYLTRTEYKYLKKVFICFYLVECSLAILERLTHTIFFYVVNSTYEELLYLNPEAWEFRSYALYPHPLANATVVVVIMTFIICSHLKLLPKIGYFFLGYISLFCFNARGAILLTTLVILPYFLWKINKLVRRKKVLVNIGLLSLIALLAFVVFHTDLSGRLINIGLNDGSTMTRLEVFSFYKFLSSQDVVWGGGEDIYYHIMAKLGAGGVENGFIVMFLQYGIIFTPILLYLLLMHQKRLLSQTYHKIDALFILSTFYLLGFMNPSLATPVPWIIFFFAYYSFRKYEKRSDIL